MRRVLLLLALAGCAQENVDKSDWERQNATRLQAEPAPVLPAYPREGELLELSVSPKTDFRFFIDPASISVEKELVRYTLVARSPTGTTNVTHEGLHCETGEVRIYAVGRDGAWAGTATGWRAIRTAWQNALYREYFCPQAQAVATRNDAIRALQTGGHSITRSLSEDIPRGGGAR